MAVPPCCRVKVEPLIVVGSIGSLKVTVRLLPVATPPVPFAGLVETATGRVVPTVAPVVKSHTKLLATALPERSLAPVVMVATKEVPGARVLDGAKVAVAPIKVTAPGTVTPPCFKVKVDVLIVAGSIGSLKVAESLLLMGTPLDPTEGVTEITTGMSVFTTAPVVKLQT